MSSFLSDFAVIMLIVVVICYIVKLFKQPIIIGYVLAGFLFSILLAKGYSSSNEILIISELGITFLLFLIGLDFSFKNLKYLGKDILIATLIQSLIFFGVAYWTARQFQFNQLQSVYLSILFIFSSTLLVAKYLEDKKETGTLHGKIIIGTLMLQDFLAILLLTFLGLFYHPSLSQATLTILGGIALLVIAYLFAEYFLNFLLKRALRYPELLFVFSLGICFFFVYLAPILGYSTSIGAFIGGVTLANTAYKNDIYGRLKPLILFFNMLFFLGLGLQVKINFGMKILYLILIFCLLNLLLKPIIIFLTLKIRGYDSKTSFLCGLNLAQMSEFGIIILASGLTLGFVSPEIMSAGIICLILTLVLSSYYIKYDAKIYHYFGKYFQQFDYLFAEVFTRKKISSEPVKMSNYNVLFFGYYDIEREVYNKLRSMGKSILVIENDPENIRLLKKENIPYLYNSIISPDFFSRVKFEKVDFAVSSLIDLEDNKMIIKYLKENNPQATVIVTAKSIRESITLYDHKADYVIYPFYLNEQHVSVLLEDYSLDANRLITKKIADLTKLKEKEEKLKSLTPKDFFVDINSFISGVRKGFK